MGKVISIVNQKGGVGKTTTTINVAAYLAQYGKRVLIIDLDPQANATSGVGKRPRELTQGLYEALAKTSAMRDIILETDHDNYHLAPATMSLAGANIELVNIEDREFLLNELVRQVRDEYDYILIDCPPSLGLLTVNGLVAADEVMIPVQSEYFALEGLGQLLNTINLVQNNIKEDLGILGAVITMYTRHNKLSGEVLRELCQYFPNRLFRTIIPRDDPLAEAPSYGQTILKYAPSSKGARAYENLAREILELS